MPDPSSPLSFAPDAPPPVSMFAGAYYSVGGESLLLSVNNAAAGVTLKLAGRTLAFGEKHPSPFEVTLTPATDRSTSTARVMLPAGWLLSAVVSVTAGTPLTGQCWARLSIVHGVNTVGPELWTLASDYVTAKKPATYPGRPIQDSLDGGGAIRSITATVPGAGAEFSETVPTGARWELIAWRHQLVTSAAVANRVSQLVLDDGANIFSKIPPGLVQAASLTLQYSFAQGFPQPTAVQATEALAPLPINHRLLAGHRIRTVTLNIQAADQYSVGQYLVREYSEAA